MSHPPAARAAASSGVLAPLYLAGFTTAFGAHGVATGLGVESGRLGLSLLGFGAILALYDVAEVVLKPVFGALSDRIGVKPVILGGLVAFALVSAVGMLTTDPVVLGVVRFAQGAAASAFSPASSSAVARLAGGDRLGRYFGRYGAWKSIGYVAGPLLGAALIALTGLWALYAALAVLAAAAAGWVALALPSLPVLARPRYTLADLVRQTTERGFVVPVLILAASTGMLGVAVGYLPLIGTRLGLGAIASAAPVAVLATVSATAQPLAGRRHDRGALTTRGAAAVALAAGAVALVLLAAAETMTPVAVMSAGAPALITAVFVAAVLVGAAVGVATPLAYAHLSAHTPPERLGRTMGNAELGRELGDAGGPLLVGAIGTAASLAAGFGALAVVTIAVAVTGAVALRAPR